MRGGREGVSDLPRYFAAFSSMHGATELIAKPLHMYSLYSARNGRARTSSLCHFSHGWRALSLAPFRICMFIPSRAFAYLPLSPPPDRAVLLNKWTRAVHPPCLSLSVAARSLVKCANNSQLVRSCPPFLPSRHSASRALQGK